MPSDNREMVLFGSMHVDPWTTNKVALSLSDAQVLAMKNLSLTASDALDAAEVARQSAKAATETYYAAVRALRTKAAECVRVIQNTAKTTNNPALYGLAQIPAPDPRSHTGTPPARPTDVRAGLNSDGSITLTWKCANPRGVSRVIYFVKRKLNGESDYSLFDTVGEKSCTDATIPRSTGGASYIITGKAGSLSGPSSEQFTVTFGVGGGGAIVMTTSADGSMKLAA
ncbi:MAG TPA: fibronectin type III domain-containing protein [Phycisphaerales bacterium]|nr:fibronectin type III domain-containing protein [Phycisphaerales bacterium]